MGGGGCGSERGPERARLGWVCGCMLFTPGECEPGEAMRLRSHAPERGGVGAMHRSGLESR